MTNDIEQLLKMAPAERRSDERIGELMVAQYYDRVYHLALSILDDPDDADDAVQTAFIHAHRSLDRYVPGESFQSWLFAIVVNASRDLLRRRKTRHNLQEAVRALFHFQNSTASPEETAIKNERRDELWQAVQSLDEKHRLAVILRYVHDLPVSEIAAILGTNEGTIHSRLHYAARKLQAWLSSPSVGAGGRK